MPKQAVCRSLKVWQKMKNQYIFKTVIAILISKLNN